MHAEQFSVGQMYEMRRRFLFFLSVIIMREQTFAAIQTTAGDIYFLTKLAARGGF